MFCFIYYCLGIPVAFILLYHLLWHFLKNVQIGDLKNKSVLITGCDSGFGYDLALRCVREGMQVFAACLTEEGRAELSQQVKHIKQHSFESFILDVRSQDSVNDAFKLVRSKLGPKKGLHAVVNNAGVVGETGWDDWLLAEDYENVWQVNTMGVIRVTHAFKQLVKAESGRIITTASVCGRIALPCIGPYTVSKFAVEAYCDTIRIEMMQFGVKAIILEPGFFKTPITSIERNKQMFDKVWKRLPKKIKEEYGTDFYDHSVQSMVEHLSLASPQTELVVDAYFHAITARWPNQRYQIGLDAKLVYIPISMLPTVLQDLVFRVLGFFKKTPKTIKRGKELLE